MAVVRYSQEQADLYSEPWDKVALSNTPDARDPKHIIPTPADPLDAKQLKVLCEALLARCKTAEGASAALPQLKALAEQYPDQLTPNLNYVTAWELTRQKKGLFEAWCDLHERFPESHKAFRYRVRWLKRMHREQEAVALIEDRLPGTPSDNAVLEQKAELYNELADAAQTEHYYRVLLAQYDTPTVRHHFGRWLQDQGRAWEAWDIIAPAVGDAHLSEAGAAFAKGLREGLDVLQGFTSTLSIQEKNTSTMAFAAALEMFIPHRVPSPQSEKPGRSAFITGSLGPGGAERQMARSVARLEQARRAGLQVAGVRLDGPADLVVKSLDGIAGHDFFVSMVSASGASMREIDNMPPLPYEALGIQDPRVYALRHFWPPSVVYGVQRMVDYFRKESVETAYIWQDGAVLFAALAALIAGVPRIVISLRGLPPSLRQHMMRPEYESMYRALAAVPGVYFISNNRTSAQAYGDWIGMDISRFGIIYNGVDFLPPEGDARDLQRWSVFMRHTAGEVGPTIGGVFRFDTDKRPLLWIDFARDYLQRTPTARFVLVGGGRLLADARARADEYGIAERILFVGLSSHVGYWLTKMDVFVLLSHFEGLPNAIIEAQLSGVPVVATPAGGTCEAIASPQGGLLLSSTETIDLTELCDKVDHMYKARIENPALATELSVAASERFSTTTMIGRTALMLSGKLEGCYE